MKVYIVFNVLVSLSCYLQNTSLTLLHTEYLDENYVETYVVE